LCGPANRNTIPIDIATGAVAVRMKATVMNSVAQVANANWLRDTLGCFNVVDTGNLFQYLLNCGSKGFDC